MDDDIKESQLPDWAVGLFIFAIGALFILLDRLAGTIFLTPEGVVVCLGGSSVIVNDLTRGSLYRIMLMNMGLMIVVLGVCFVLLDMFFVVPPFLTPIGAVLSGVGGVMAMIEFGRTPLEMGIVGSTIVVSGILVNGFSSPVFFVSGIVMILPIILKLLSRIVTFKKVYSIIFMIMVLSFSLFGEEMFKLIIINLPYVLAFMVLIPASPVLRELAREDITEDEKKGARMFFGLCIALIMVMLYVVGRGIIAR